MLRLVSRRLYATAAAGSVGKDTSTTSNPSVKITSAGTASSSLTPAEDNGAPMGSGRPALSPEELERIRGHLREYGFEKEAELLEADGLPPVPEPLKPYTPPLAFPVRPRRGIEAPEYYNSRSAIGHPDTLAERLTAGRSDPEYQWLKLLCFICVMSTMGTWVYGVFFPQNMKRFKDEPWSSFRN